MFANDIGLTVNVLDMGASMAVGRVHLKDKLCSTDGWRVDLKKRVDVNVRD